MSDLIERVDIITTRRMALRIPISDRAVAEVPITDSDRKFWDEQNHGRTVSVTLTVAQWAIVVASMRVTMAASPNPGIEHLAHDEVKSQILS